MNLMKCFKGYRNTNVCFLTCGVLWWINILKLKKGPGTENRNAYGLYLNVSLHKYQSGTIHGVLIGPTKQMFYKRQN